MMETFALLVDEADRVEPYDPARAATMLAIATNAGAAAAEADLIVMTARRSVRLSPADGGPVSMLAALALAAGLAFAGAVEEARSILEPLIPALETIDPLGEAGRLVTGMLAVLSWIDDASIAKRMLERIVRTVRGASAITMLPYPLSFLSEIEFRSGHIVGAHASAAEAAQLAVETGEGAVEAFALVTLARVEALRGLERDCRQHAAAALDRASRVGATSIENYAASVLGVLDLSLGHPERATPHLEECARLEIEYRLGLPDVVQWNADLIEAYVRTGRTVDAHRELERLEAQARSTGSRWAAATSARCRGLLADEDAYEAVFRAALELHGDREPFERARTELCLGRRRRHSRRRAEARAILTMALSTFEALGAEPWAEQARAELRAAGASPALSPTGSLMALTPQELQIALVVAGGATNREAAAALFISPKTVEFHLSHVYGKLGVRSRTELALEMSAAS
jgi:DNA-binding CsgD family transcriptional regulator